MPGLVVEFVLEDGSAGEPVELEGEDELSGVQLGDMGLAVGEALESAVADDTGEISPEAESEPEVGTEAWAALGPEPEPLGGLAEGLATSEADGESEAESVPDEPEVAEADPLSKGESPEPLAPDANCAN